MRRHGGDIAFERVEIDDQRRRVEPVATAGHVDERRVGAEIGHGGDHGVTHAIATSCEECPPPPFRVEELEEVGCAAGAMPPAITEMPPPHPTSPPPRVERS